MKRKIITSILVLLLTAFSSSGFCATQTTQTAKTTPEKPAVAQQPIKYITVAPLDVVNSPQKYLNKNVKMTATFAKFTNLGLDYKPAMRSSQDYISFLILRDDVGENIIPLSEMKLFIKRKSAEKFIELETGDKIQIDGNVFSNALSDPWIEVAHITILSKKTAKKS